MLDKTIKEAYLRDVAILNSPNLNQHHHQEATEIYTPKRRTNNDTTTKHDIYSTITMIHNGYIPPSTPLPPQKKELYDSFKLLKLWPGLYILL
jgi:hypothetical protein